MGCLPRNDGNGIYPENTCELLYFDLNSWQFLGIKETMDLFIKYEDVAANIVYWLRNYNSSVEERVFAYDNYQAKFW